MTIFSSGGHPPSHSRLNLRLTITRILRYDKTPDAVASW